jgi:hypothetical protein
MAGYCLELHAILIVHDHQPLTIHRLQGFPAKLKHGTFTYLVCARALLGTG